MNRRRRGIEASHVVGFPLCVRGLVYFSLFFCFFISCIDSTNRILGFLFYSFDAACIADGIELTLERVLRVQWAARIEYHAR